MNAIEIYIGDSLFFFFYNSGIEVILGTTSYLNSITENNHIFEYVYILNFMIYFKCTTNNKREKYL